MAQDAGEHRLGVRAQSPSSEVTFPQIARLELDDLLEQLIERAQDVMNTQGRLRGLLAATRAIASDLSLPALLRRITQSACELVGARYGALGVLGPGEQLMDFITVGLDDDDRASIGELPRGKGILGLLISTPTPLRLHEISDHPQAIGLPPGHPPMHSFLGVPIRVGEQVFGNLYLTEKVSQQDFTAEDEELLSALASAAGVAIDNARLYEAERRRQRWLAASAEVSRELLAGVSDPLPLITARAREVAGADLATIMVPVADAPDMLLAAAADGSGAAALVGRMIPRAGSLAAQALDEDRDFLFRDSRANIGFHRSKAVPEGPVLVIRVPEAHEGQKGVLSLARHVGAAAFSDEEKELVVGFADQAGVALRLAHAQAERRRLLLFEDRDRIARDLHDHVIQRLFAAGLGLTALASRTEEPATRQRLGEYTEQLDDTIRSIRQAIFELRRTTETGLQAKILDVGKDVAPALGFSPDLRFEGPLDALLETDTADHVIAVVREALVNAAKHAQATAVSASLSAGGQQLLVTITDNGVGLGEHARESGLANMRSRAEQLGGTFTVISPVGTTGRGTRLEWSVPLYRSG